MDEFRQHGDEWATCARAGDGLDLKRIKVASPAMKLMRFSVGAYFRISTAHERRHLWQAEQVNQEGNARGWPV